MLMYIVGDPNHPMLMSHHRQCDMILLLDSAIISYSFIIYLPIVFNAFQTQHFSPLLFCNFVNEWTQSILVLSV